MKTRTIAPAVTRLYVKPKTKKDGSVRYVARIVVPKRKEEYMHTADTVEAAIAGVRKKVGVRQ